ncbi:MAG: CBS domain-containing protein [Mariprofundus sp.]
MTPRVNIEALSSDLTIKDALDFYMTHTHSRIPIYEKTIDKIDYFITIRDILGKDKTQKIKDLDLPKVIKVPLNQPINKLLENFQKSHKLISIAIDEYG